MAERSKKQSFFIYDLETSGINPREARIMQFAGIRTDLELNPIEEPHNYLIKMNDDVLPEPDAIMVTGITPQQTIADGYTEAEFLRVFHEQIALPGTIFMGYNSVRFDDEFMRFLQYRNFYDAYEWQYRDGRSRWDLLDVVRMTRALRPEGIEWPFDSSGSATNRLELLTSVNGLEHASAHDALSDVRAVIALARLLKSKQPKLFDYLLTMRDKQKVTALVTGGQPFVYSSGRYASEFEKTTIAAHIGELPKGQGGLVFDLRYDPKPFINMNAAELAEAWRKRKDEPGPRLPVKSIKYNRCPAVAPLGVLDEKTRERLKISLDEINTNFAVLKQYRSEFVSRVLEAAEHIEGKRQAQFIEDDIDVDAKLYEGFFPEEDRTKMSVVRAASPDELRELDVYFRDSRLKSLMPLYKARNFPQALTDDDRAMWERYRERKLLGGGTNSRLAKYLARIGQLMRQSDLSAEKKYLLEELQLYAQSIVPSEDA